MRQFAQADTIGAVGSFAVFSGFAVGIGTQLFGANNEFGEVIVLEFAHQGCVVLRNDIGSAGRSAVALIIFSTCRGREVDG